MTQPMQSYASGGPLGAFGGAAAQPGDPLGSSTVRRHLSDTAHSHGAEGGSDDVFGSDLPLVRRKELGEALLADPEWVAKVVAVVGDAVERRVVRDLVRHGHTGMPGMI